MTNMSINGKNVYCVTKYDIDGYSPTPFAKAAETWKEGKNKDNLTVQELNDIKQRYKNVDNMSVPDAIQTFGDMVEAGLMTISEARNTWYGAVPMTPEQLKNTTGFLTKDDPKAAMKQAGWGTMLARKEEKLLAGSNEESLFAAADLGGIDSYRCLYNLLQNEESDTQNLKHYQMYSAETYMEIWNRICG